MLLLLLFFFSFQRAVNADRVQTYTRVSTNDQELPQYFADVMMTSYVISLNNHYLTATELYPETWIRTLHIFERKGGRGQTSHHPYTLIAVPASLAFFKCKILRNVVLFFFIYPSFRHLQNSASRPLFTRLPPPLFSPGFPSLSPHVTLPVTKSDRKKKEGKKGKDHQKLSLSFPVVTCVSKKQKYRLVMRFYVPWQWSSIKLDWEHCAFLSLWAYVGN